MKNPFPKRLLPPAPAYTLPLSRRAFRKALICGQGRAVLHVQQFGTEGVEDLILQAVFKRAALEVGDDRSDLLHSILRTAGMARQAMDALDTWLEQSGNTLHVQHDDLLIRWHQEGDDRALQIIRKHAMATALSNDYAYPGSALLHWIEHEPEIAIPLMMKAYGEALFNGRPAEWTPSFVIYNKPEQTARWHALIMAHAEDSPACRAFAEAHAQILRKQQGSSTSRPDWSHMNAEAIEQALLQPGTMIWEREALLLSDDVMTELYHRMVATKDFKTWMALMRVFGFRKAPQIDPDWFKIALRAGRRKSGCAAIQALAHFDLPSVRKLGRKLSQSRNPCTAQMALELFRFSLPAPIHQRLMKRLHKLSTQSWRHLDAQSLRTELPYAFTDSLFSKLKEIEPWVSSLCSHPHLSRVPAIQLWAWNDGTCALCRSDAFEALAALGVVSPEILSEALEDSCELTREAAERLQLERGQALLKFTGEEFRRC